MCSFIDVAITRICLMPLIVNRSAHRDMYVQPLSSLATIHALAGLPYGSSVNSGAVKKPASTR